MTISITIPVNFGARGPVGLTIGKLLEAQRCLHIHGHDVTTAPFTLLFLGPRQYSDLIAQSSMEKGFTERGVLKFFLGFGVYVESDHIHSKSVIARGRVDGQDIEVEIFCSEV